jgi:hypothetical protein
MILLVLAPLLAVAIVCVLARVATASRGAHTGERVPRTPRPPIRRVVRHRLRHTLRYRLRRARLPRDWWEQFERDFAAYVDPSSVRARNRERG